MPPELKPVYLIAGSDRPKVTRAVRRLRDRIGVDAVELLSAAESPGDAAVAACNSLGLFTDEARLVVVEDVERWRAPDAKAVAGGPPVPESSERGITIPAPSSAEAPRRAGRRSYPRRRTSRLP